MRTSSSSMHSSDSGYTRYTNDWTGPSEMLPFKLDSFRYMTGGHRPIQDAMAAFVCHGVFARFPELRVASIEAGGEWIPAFVQHLGDTHKKMPHAFDGDPVEQFKRNVYVSPFHEDDLGAIIDVIGADHVLFGSDYPHPEGLAEPCSYVDHLPEGLADEDVKNIMGGNLGAHHACRGARRGGRVGHRVGTARVRSFAADGRRERTP